MSAHRLLRASFAILTGWWLVMPMSLGQTVLSDQQMKAAYVLNFVRYVDWPERAFATPESPLAICVFGESGASGLTGIAGKVIRSHPIQVRSVTGAEEARYCHVLFVSEYDTRRFVGILRALQNAPILTISEADGFIDVGGMIGLVHLDNRLQFEVNLGVVQQAQLKASSQLLRLARNVIEARR
jgi:hypothetical protein